MMIVINRIGMKKISIHAPLTGCDCKVQSSTVLTEEFQSTHPLRDATFQTPKKPHKYRRFQSTHPLRDATLRDIANYLEDVSISIHAPLTGCDYDTTFCESRNPRFQSTHPLRDATFRKRSNMALDK